MQTWNFSPAIIAHRGDNAHAPENTLAAFRQAIEKKANGIELDVQLSADGKVVVIHDTTLDRTTNGQGKVGAQTFAELRKLDAGGGELIPALEEVLDILPEGMILNIELKGSDKRLAPAVTELVAKHGKQDQIVYSSFNPFLLQALKKTAPNARLGLLLLPGFCGTFVHLLFEPLLQPWSLHPQFKSITPGFIKKAKRHNRQILTYTVNQLKDVRRMIEIGVDGIITDDPEVITALR